MTWKTVKLQWLFVNDGTVNLQNLKQAQLQLATSCYCVPRHTVMPPMKSSSFKQQSAHSARTVWRCVLFKPLCSPWHSLPLPFPQIVNCCPVQTCECKQSRFWQLLQYLTTFALLLQIQMNALRVTAPWGGCSESKRYKHLGCIGKKSCFLAHGLMAYSTLWTFFGSSSQA